MNYKTKRVYTLILLILLTFIVSACGKMNGKDGAQGAAGKPGAVGAIGPQGSPGVDTSTVYMVHLCPGASVYPSIFVEYAFCVNDALYGTYSANGGFSTLLPDGHYSSSAINSSCSFTVQDHCVVVDD